MSRFPNDPLRQAALVHGPRPAVVLPSEVVTWSRLDGAVDRAAGVLAAGGIGPGTIVAFRAPTDLATVVVLHALWRLSAVAAPIGMRLPPEGFRAAVRQLGPTSDRGFHAGSGHSTGPGALAELGAPVEFGTPVVLATGDLEALVGEALKDAPAVPVPFRRGPSRPATAVFTSGSSGEPKAAVHALSAHLASAAGAAQTLAFGAESRWLLALPLHHVGGLAVLFRAAFIGGSVALAEPGEDPFDAAARTGSTHVSLVATQLVRGLAAHRDAPPGAVCLLLGGGPIPPDAVEEAERRGWPVSSSYGLTESASLVTATKPGAPDGAATTAGRPLPGRRVRIGPNSTIHVAGRTLASGYLVAGRLEPVRGRDGWFATGDLGEWDEAGRLVVTGRADAMFVSGGENIHPEAIERVIGGVPGVRQVTVVPVPDPEFGARPVAFVDGDAGPAALREAVLARLPAFMVPMAWLPWPADLAATGIKPSRRALAERALRLAP